MSQITINRDLNSTGKKFFISNYFDVKEFWRNDITKQELISRIKNKADWRDKTDNSIENKISSIKSFFDKEWNLDALKNTISSRLDIDLITKAKQIYQDETGRVYDETIDKIEGIDKVDESPINLQDIKTKEMKIPLNQIFYGPPGTGKTYNLSKEAEKIINSTSSTSANTREEKFNLICESVRNISGLEIKANSLYRNERAILWMFGYLLEPPHDETNSIKNSEAIANGMDPSPSSWAQYSQYLTQFGFVDDWRRSTEINLNERGLDLKNGLVEYLSNENLNYNDLKNWNQDAPDIVKSSYFRAISEIKKDDFTNQMKVIYCVLNLALNNLLRSETEYKKKEASDREEASAYIDIEDDNADIKWIGQIGRSLRGLGIVDNYILDSTGKNTYHLSENGLELVDKIIEKWEK